MTRLASALFNEPIAGLVIALRLCSRVDLVQSKKCWFSVQRPNPQRVQHLGKSVKKIDIMPLSPGQQYEVSFRYTQEQVNTFISLTGDDNPIHHDAEYAAKTVFKRPVIHGMLTASVFSRIFGSLFPGEGTIYLSQELNFHRPMFVEEDYRAVVEVAELFPDKNQGRFSTVIYNPTEKPTISGAALLLNPAMFA